MTNFAQRLMEVMAKNGISQSVLAERLGMEPSNINHFIAGRREPNMENLAKLLNELWFVDARWLITGKGAKP